MSRTIIIPNPESATAHTISCDSIDYSTFAEIDTKSANEVHLVDTTQGMETPMQIRYSISDVANIYSGTSIDPSVYAPIRRGKSLLAQMTLTAKVTDNADPSYMVLLPISMHCVIKVPQSDYLTTDHIENILKHLIDTLYDSTGTFKVGSLLRGALKPSNLG